MPKLKMIESLNNFRIKHEPEILMSVGIAGLLVSTAWAVKATIKAAKICEQKKVAENKDKLSFKEIFLATWKLYLPVVISTALSVPCIIVGNRVSSRRTAALATAYTLSQTALQEYQTKTKEMIGEVKEKAIKDEIVRDKAKQIESKEVYLVGSDEQIFLEPLTGRYFKSTWNRIQKACNDINEEALGSSCGSYTLDDWFERLGLESTDLGRLLGWSTPFYGNSAGLMKIHMTTAKTKDDKPCGAICYDVNPYELK